jgi:hypothetical protein
VAEKALDSVVHAEPGACSASASYRSTIYPGDVGGNRFPIEAGHVMMVARAVGDANEGDEHLVDIAIRTVNEDGVETFKGYRTAPSTRREETGI